MKKLKTLKVYCSREEIMEQFIILKAENEILKRKLAQMEKGEKEKLINIFERQYKARK